MKIAIVLGAGFGDEGKGSFVNYLASQNNTAVVVRFNGGHQVGHTVVTDKTRHVFSNFGSGTLQDVPTYWSEYCTVHPVGVKREGDALRAMGYSPKLVISPDAMVTTPFDIFRNQELNNKNNHGSVGVGFGATIQRNEDHFKLYARDLKYPQIRDEKLRLMIQQYYRLPFDPTSDTPQHRTTSELYKNFIEACDDLVSRYEIAEFNQVFRLNSEIIFEGGQGIMLDMDYGFFPHVTRSNTTSKNVWEFISKNNIHYDSTPVTYYMTRAYQTRHGNGYMSNAKMDISYIKPNPNETNVDNYQGIFRKSPLDLDMLEYALNCDRFHNPDSHKAMVITCLDQIDSNLIPVTVNGDLIKMTYKQIGNYNNIFDIYPTYSDKGYGKE